MKGGKRKGAGRKQGTLLPQTLEKTRVLAELRQRTMRSADKLWNAQFSKAVGSIMVYRIDEFEDENGKKKREHILIEDADEIKEVLDENEGLSGNVGENYYIVTTVPPDNKAIDSMLDRTFGKSAQTVEITDNSPSITETARAIFRELLELGHKRERIIKKLEAEFPAVDVEVLSKE